MRCEGDILLPPRPDPRRHVRGRVAVAAYRGCAYGFKLNVRTARVVTHRCVTVELFVDALAEDGFSFVRLGRNDKLRQAVSQSRAHATDTFHLFRPDDRAPVRIDPMLVIFNLRAYETQEAILDSCVKGKRVLNLSYEADLESPDRRADTLNRVFSLVGIDPVPVSEPTLYRTTPRALSDAIENLDELTDALRGTRYERYLAR